MNSLLTLDEAFESARKYALSKSPKAVHILDLIVDKNKRGYLDMAYAYLRWIDDKVDDPDLPVDLKIDFIRSQIQLLDDMQAGKDTRLSRANEWYAKYFMDFCKREDDNMPAAEMRNMAEAISWDAERLKGDGTFNESRLRAYIDKMSQSLFNILQSFILPPGLRSPVFLGKFTANVQILRDLHDDFKAGFINISCEDLHKYNINVKITDNNRLNNDNLVNWIKIKLAEISNILIEETKVNSTLPFRLRLFTWYAHIYYLPKINRIKIYSYDLELIKNRKIFYKELAVYFISGIQAVRLFVKEIL